MGFAGVREVDGDLAANKEISACKAHDAAEHEHLRKGVAQAAADGGGHEDGDGAHHVAAVSETRREPVAQNKAHEERSRIGGDNPATFVE